MRSIQMLSAIRAAFLKNVEGLTLEELLFVPAGFRNNILWHLGHVVATQQSLHYKLSGLPLLVSDEFMSTFRPGTSPEDWTATPDVEEVRRLLIAMPEQLASDLEAGKFREYQGFTSRTGIHCENVEAAIEFNLFHEGIHLGTIQTYKKMLAA
jgi:hypothetical protein